jgi:hypothetical protein
MTPSSWNRDIHRAVVGATENPYLLALAARVFRTFRSKAS